MERSKSKNRTSKITTAFVVMIGLLTAFVALADADLHLPGKVAVPNSLSIGKTSEADASAALDVVSTSKGSLLPRMTSTQRDAISSPATGLIVFNTTSGQYEFYTGSGWSAIGGLSGPSSSIDGDFALFNGTTGKLIKDAGSNLTWNGSALGITGSYSVSSTTTASIPLPRMTNTQMNAITPLSEAFGVWNLNAHKPYWYNGSGWHETSFIDTVETLTNKTLTDPNINAVDFSEQSATPSTPSSGTKKMYCKNDGVCYTLDSSGNEVPVGSGSGGFDNLLADQYPTFDSSVSAWTASGGTLTTATSGSDFMGMGKSNATWDSSASGQTLTLPAVTIPNGYANTNGLYRCKVMNRSGATYTMGTWNGTTLANTITIDPGMTPKYVEIMAPLGAAGTTTAIRFTSVASNEPLISIKDCYIGQNFEVGTVAQATLIGQIKITGCSWSTPSTSFTNFSATTGCTYTVLAGSGVSAPATMIPGIKFASLPPGNYTLHWEGRTQNTTSNASAYFQFSDGTNISNEISQLQSGSSNPIHPGFQQTISYSAPQSNVTLQIQAKTDSGGTAGLNANNPSTISVYYFPTQSQQAVRADNSDFDPTAFTPTYSGIGTVSSSNLFYWRVGKMLHIGGTFVTGTTAASTASFTLPAGLSIDATKLPSGISAGGKIVRNVSGPSSSAQEYNDVMLVDTANPTLIFFGTANNAHTPASEQTGANAFGSSETELITNFEVPIAGWTNNGRAPLLVGSVTSSTSGMERMERAHFGGSGSQTSPTVCSSSPCTIYSQSGSWLTSITRNSTGDYTLNIASGEFSDIPTCNFIRGKTGTTNYGIWPAYTGTPSATSVEFSARDITNTAADSEVYVLCQGPR